MFDYFKVFSVTFEITVKYIVREVGRGVFRKWKIAEGSHPFACIGDEAFVDSSAIFCVGFFGIIP